MTELVNHPAHYNREGRKECIEEFIERYGIDYTAIWALITADKYLYRIGLKDDAEQKAKKINWYLDFVQRHYIKCSIWIRAHIVNNVGRIRQGADECLKKLKNSTGS